MRDGRSFATRTVQARQRGRCIFTTTISFAKTEGDDPGEEKKTKKTKRMVSHAAPMPEGVMASKPGDDWVEEEERLDEDAASTKGPFQSAGLEVVRGDDATAKPEDRRCRTWMRARGRISPEGGHQAHLNALAYMSDSYFIGTVSRIHGLWRFPVRPSDVAHLPPGPRDMIRRQLELEGQSADPAAWEGRPHVGMLVSLDHSIYFHEPRRVRADEWMFTEMESPWAGEERGVVTQRIFAADGTLLASCFQEVSLFPLPFSFCPYGLDDFVVG